jgi:hypothetical protein
MPWSKKLTNFISTKGNEFNLNMKPLSNVLIIIIELWNIKKRILLRGSEKVGYEPYKKQGYVRSWVYSVLFTDMIYLSLCY